MEGKSVRPRPEASGVAAQVFPAAIIRTKIPMLIRVTHEAYFLKKSRIRSTVGDPVDGAGWGTTCAGWGAVVEGAGVAAGGAGGVVAGAEAGVAGCWASASAKMRFPSG